MADAQPLHLVTNLLNTSKNKPQGNVLVFGAWGCAKDPMMREFLVPSSSFASQYRSPPSPCLLNSLVLIFLSHVLTPARVHTGTIGLGKLVDV